MPRINLSGGSYVARSASVSVQRVLNLYPEPLPQVQGEPVSFAYYPTPGLETVATTGGSCRGAYQSTQGHALFVMGDTVLSLSPGGQTTTIGTISAGSAPVRMRSRSSRAARSRTVPAISMEPVMRGAYQCGKPHI